MISSTLLQRSKKPTQDAWPPADFATDRVLPQQPKHLNGPDTHFQDRVFSTPQRR